jgi:NAD(P)H-hydrate repair Nnr-like enzyme with NAD(P)H-hydrate dehydratase domain
MSGGKIKMQSTLDKIFSKYRDLSDEVYQEALMTLERIGYVYTPTPSEARKLLDNMPEEKWDSDESKALQLLVSAKESVFVLEGEF